MYGPTIFATSRKKVLDPNGPYISTKNLKKRNVCLSVILEFCLSIGNFSASISYILLCRGFKCLLKILYVIQSIPNVAIRFFDFRGSLVAEVKNIVLFFPSIKGINFSNKRMKGPKNQLVYSRRDTLGAISVSGNQLNVKLKKYYDLNLRSEYSHDIILCLMG